MKDNLLSKPGLFIAGPLFLICTQALAVHFGTAEAIYLLIISLFGMILCSYYGVKGCIATLVFVALGALGQFGFSESYGLWQIGLEGSVACSFVITTMMLDQQKSELKALGEMVQTKESTISNLEEDLSKIHENTISEQLALQEKNGQLQKELEEIQAEHSSILVLNEVLRKTAAAQTKEMEELSQGALDQERRIGTLLEQIEQLQNEVARISDGSQLIAENGQLQEALNAARVDKEQTYLINENLARLHAKEMQKGQEATEKLHALHNEMQKVQEEYSLAKGEIKMLSEHLDQVSEELERALTSLKQAEKVQMEKNFLAERLANAEAQINGQKGRIEVLSQRPETSEEREKLIAKEGEIQKMGEELSQKNRELENREKEIAQLELRLKEVEKTFDEKDLQLSSLQKELEAKEGALAEIKGSKTDDLNGRLAQKEASLNQIEERLKELSQVEALYKQLKTQFEEKNEILHETRSKLFQTETLLQKIQIENEHRALNKDPLPPEWEKDIKNLEEEISNLRAENQYLQEIVTQLSKGETPPPQLEF